MSKGTEIGGFTLTVSGMGKVVLSTCYRAVKILNIGKNAFGKVSQRFLTNELKPAFAGGYNIANQQIAKEGVKNSERIASSLKKAPMRLEPDVKTGRAHSVFKRNPIDGKVVKYNF